MKQRKTHATPSNDIESNNEKYQEMADIRHQARPKPTALRRTRTQQAKTIAMFVVDVIAGLMMSLLLAVIIIWLDLRGIATLPMAQTFEMALFHDDAFLQLAAESGVYFLTQQELNDRKKTIANESAKVLEEKRYLEKYMQEAEELQLQLPPLRQEAGALEDIFKEEIWCPDCMWTVDASCKDRMEFIANKDKMTDKYGQRYTAKTYPQCNKRKRQNATEAMLQPDQND